MTRGSSLRGGISLCAVARFGDFSAGRGDVAHPKGKITKTANNPNIAIFIADVDNSNR